MEKSWHYLDLINAHKLFPELEGRYRFYEAYIKNRDPMAWLNSPDVPLKEALLLFGWVHSWDPNFEGDLVRFLQIYEEIFPIIKNFEDKPLAAVDLTDNAKHSLRIIFDKTAKCCRTSRYESTDASKLLHGIVPNLFVMWDDKIRKGIVGIRESSRDYDGRCYAYEFLPKMQEFARLFLDSYVKEKGGDHLRASEEISQMADGYTLTKLIDEFNYVRFTKKKAFEETRKYSENDLANIQNDFHREMLNSCETMKLECDYNPVYFLKMARKMGSLRTAKILLSKEGPQSGLKRLRECGRLDLSMEALALKSKFKILFTDEELNTAKQRLEAYGYVNPES